MNIYQAKSSSSGPWILSLLMVCRKGAPVNSFLLRLSFGFDLYEIWVEFILILNRQFAGGVVWREKHAEKEHRWPRSFFVSHSGSHPPQHQDSMLVEVQQSRFVSRLISDAAADANPQNLCSRYLPPFLLQLDVNLGEGVSFPISFQVFRLLSCLEVLARMLRWLV